jgi:hypothetical protein
MMNTETLEDVTEAELYDRFIDLQAERDARRASLSSEEDVEAIKAVAAEQVKIRDEVLRRSRPARAAALTAKADAVELPEDTRKRRPKRGLMPTHPFTAAHGRRQLVGIPPTSAR